MRGKRGYRKSVEQASGGEADENKVKMAEPVKKSKAGLPFRMLKRVVENPNFGYQFMVILLTLTQDNVRMDRRIDTMTSSVDTLRNITGVINGAMQSLKTAAEAPRQIRRMVKPDGS